MGDFSKMSRAKCLNGAAFVLGYHHQFLFKMGMEVFLWWVLSNFLFYYCTFRFLFWCGWTFSFLTLQCSQHMKEKTQDKSCLQGKTHNFSVLAGRASTLSNIHTVQILHKHNHLLVLLLELRGKCKVIYNLKQA